MKLLKQLSMKTILSIIAVLIVLLLCYSCGSKSNDPGPGGNGGNPIRPDTAVSVTGFTPDSAKAGADVTITGKNFGTVVNDVTVKIGAVSITPQSVTDNNIVFVVPQNSPSGVITVAVKSHASVTTAAAFTFIAPPTPPKPISFAVDGGHGKFDGQGNLLGVDVSNSNNNTEFKTTTGADTKISLANAQNANISMVNGLWQATFPKYSTTDTLNQPYLRAIQTDATNGKVTEYRAYVTGTSAVLIYLSTASTQPASMDVTTFVNSFTSSSQKILIAP